MKSLRWSVPATYLLTVILQEEHLFTSSELERDRTEQQNNEFSSTGAWFTSVCSVFVLNEVNWITCVALGIWPLNFFHCDPTEDQRLLLSVMSVEHYSSLYWGRHCWICWILNRNTDLEKLPAVTRETYSKLWVMSNNQENVTKTKPRNILEMGRSEVVY